VHDRTLTDAFSRQAEGFNRSPVANAESLLEEIIGLARPGPDERWLEAACGPGIISRRLAPLVSEVHGVDATPAMIQVAEREARREHLSNLSFQLGDATRLAAEPASYDGFIARFALHHIPVPARLFEEAFRVVRPGGRVVMIDHLADADGDSFAWSQEVERLRDPSHWATLSLEQARRLGRSAGLAPEGQLVTPMDMDFDDWLTRGASDPQAAALVRGLVNARPAGTECFRLREVAGRRALQLQIWIAAWHRPDAGALS